MLITTGSVVGAFAVADLIGGIVLLGSKPAVGMALIILGSLLVLVAATLLVGLVLAKRMRPATLSAGQRRGVVAFLRVSRYLRGAVEAAVGTALIVTGVATLVGGSTYGVWILLFGIVLGLLAAANFWIARHIRPAPPTDFDLPTQQ